MAEDSTLKHPLQPEETTETEVGNYFVANYPPFSFWKPEHKQEALDLLETPAPEDVPLGVYFHIPFCRKRCHFCYFRVYTDKNAGEIRAYINAALREMERYAEKPYVAGRKPEFIYFGGGTPSYLSNNQLEDLTSRMKDLLPWDEAKEVAFECEPGTLNESKLNKIREIGVTRLSLGVENFDDHVLETNGRAHRSKEIERAYLTAKALAFPSINIDLIAGMMNETEENWKRTVEKAISLDPEMVTIYQMEVPYNTTIYQRMKEGGQVTAPVADWKTKRRWVHEAFAAFEAAGYTVTSAYTVAKNPENVKFVYRDSLWEGADLLPLGVASFGSLGGMHVQNHHDVGPYMDAVDRGDNPLFRAYPCNAEEKLIREFILKLKLGTVKPSFYAEKFDVDVLEKFKEPLADLQRRGLFKINEDEISVSREGLLKIDRLLHEFFLPQHRNSRYA